MRRMWAAGAAIVVCLALGGLPAVGQDDATWISGSVSCEVSDWGTESQQDGVASIRDRLATCTVTASDPRASGVGSHVYSEDCRSGSCIDWGTYEVVGPDGAWSGPWTGIESPEGILTAYSLQSGSGAYAGWSLVTVNVCDCTTGTITLDGVLYEARHHPSDRCRHRRTSSHSHPPAGWPVPLRGGPLLVSMAATTLHDVRLLNHVVALWRHTR